jgi:serine/threonine-protein kinase
MVSRAKVFGVAGFERQFAVKRFAPELTVGAVAQALSAAARSYGSLEHPRIARMSEFGVAQGQTFTAVEYVAGLDAFRLLQEAKLAGVAIAAGGALALVSQAARAVGYAHGRGLSHLGLCPTNVVVTVDGDVKVTDFGILAATMPPRPVEASRLAHRVPYLAPEQLAGEATSAATDVFVLGVIAYELVTGQRAYRGDTPGAIAQAILSGPPAEPPLPRPIVRVLQRCLARSPFERFPDARALADALDAALRVAPVPGTRKDIGAQIKTTLDRYAALNEGNLSGMVALNLPSSPPETRVPDQHDLSTQPYLRPDTAKTDVTPVVPSSATTLTDMPKPFSTVAGLAPPPIPVPPGVTPPPNPIPAPTAGAPKTMLGLPAVMPVKKPQVPGVIPPIAKPLGSAQGADPNGSMTRGGPPTVKPPLPAKVTPPPLPAVPKAGDFIEEPSGIVEISDATPLPPPSPSDSDRMPAIDPATMQGLGPPARSPGTITPPIGSRTPKPTPGQSFESATGEMSSTMLDELNKRSVKNTDEIATIKAPESAKPADRAISSGDLAIPSAGNQANAFASEVKTGADFAPDERAQTTPYHPPTAPAPTPAPVSTPAPAPAPAPAPMTASKPSAPRSKAPMLVLALVGLGGAAAAGWYVFSTLSEKPEKPTVVAGSGSEKKTTTTAPADAAIAQPATKVDAAVVAQVTPDAGAVAAPTVDAAVVAQAPIDAAVDKPPEVKPTAKSDKLQISSKPAGARVFIDGADQGVTPLKLPGSADRHTMVVLMPGHELYIGEVDGRGVFDIALKPVTPTGGHAGIKVIKCKAKDRYYVYVDGAPTGMTCPTERIDTVVGNHVVEVYDIVTDSRRKFDVFVKDERLSARVRIDD